MNRFLRVLLVIVAVAFGIRVLYVATAKAGPCRITLPNGFVADSPSKCEVGDQLFYNSEANYVADGHGFNEPLARFLGTKSGPAADHPPLTVFVLTPVSWLSDHPPLSWFIDEPLHDHVREHRYTMVVLGTINVLLIGLLGRRAARGLGAISADAVGLVAAGIAAISPNIWVNDVLVMSETVTIMVVLGAMLAAFALRDRPTLGRAALLGLFCGLAALSRAELILLVLLLALAVPLMLRGPADRGALTVAAVAVAVLVIAPWVGFNLSRFHDRTFISTNDGIALLGSNCPKVYYGDGIGLTSLGECLVTAPKGDQSQVSSYYRKKAIDYMRANKGRVPIVVLARVGRTWGLFRPGDMIKYNVGEGREEWATRLGMIVYYPTLIAAIAGAVLFWRRRGRFGLWVLLTPAIALTVGVAITYGQTRFRAAAEPSLAVLAATAIVALFGVIANRRSHTDRGEGVLVGQ